MLRAEFRLPSITAEEAAPERKAPIRVKFEIPYFTVSGIQVCFYIGHDCRVYDMELDNVSSLSSVIYALSNSRPPRANCLFFSD
jgi:hypothetical protein